MIASIILTATLAVAMPTAAPAEQPPRTIITVISSPYCNSLAEHFNSALLPMLANDRTLDGVSVQLDDLNALFSVPNYTQRFLHVRDHLMQEGTELDRSMEVIQHEINLLRDGSLLSTDPQAVAEIHQAAATLQTAYDHQKQVAIDLQSVYRLMMEYPIEKMNPALGGFDPEEMRQPPEMRDMKSYLKFNKQRRTIADNEDKAVDIAYTAAQNYCVPKK